MNVSRADIRHSVNRETVRSVSKLVLVAAWLLLVLYLLTLLPGIDRLVPQTPVTFAAVVGAVATAVMVGLLLYLAPKLATLVRVVLDEPRPVVENFASAVYWFVVLAAIVVAHRGFAGLLMPLVESFEWVYDVAFLLVALPVVAVIAARLYASLDPSSELLADKLVGPGPDSDTEAK